MSKWLFTLGHLSYDDNADLLQVEQDDQQSHEEDTNRDGNESSDDNDNADFVHPFAPSAQRLKDKRKVDKYVEIYTEDGYYWADLWENNRSKYYRMKNQKKTKKGNYRTDMQVEQDERQSLEDATNGDGDNTKVGFMTYLYDKLVTRHV